MLKKFLLNALSSFVGTWMAVLLIVISCVLFCIGIAGNMALGLATSGGEVKSRSILVLDLNGVIEEREMPMEPDIASVLNGNLKSPQTLDVLVQAIREGAKNDDIAALYLKCGSIQAGGATLNALRQELLDFKKSTKGGKKIFAYGDSYSQGAYFVASAADSIFMNPAGELSLQGLGSTIPYFKGLLDKVGVKFQVVKVGTFKSAVEPYILETMSAPARAQLDTLLGSNWKYIREGIASSRSSITADGIDSLVSRKFISFAPSSDAVKAGLIDSLIYEREMDKRLANLVGREEKKLNFVSPETLIAQTPWGEAYKSKNQIAVLFACGEIADGNNNQINFENLVPIIKDLAEDDKVKGMVMRVNSPGGSVFGSDQIGEALDYFQSKGKPLCVSMGDYAASGGYWISAKANRIFADPMTITGSIGIFGLLPCIEGTLDKVGVNMEMVSTNPNAAFPSLFKEMTPEQAQIMQAYVERGYDQFVSRVATGRKMKKAEVLRIAEGRVWDGNKAKSIGLVDQLGSLQDAISWTAAKCGVADKYDVAAYPQVEPNIWSILQMGGMDFAQFRETVNQKDETFITKYLIERLLSRKRILALMPEYRVLY